MIHGWVASVNEHLKGYLVKYRLDFLLFYSAQGLYIINKIHSLDIALIDVVSLCIQENKLKKL